MTDPTPEERADAILLAIGRNLVDVVGCGDPAAAIKPVIVGQIRAAVAAQKERDAKLANHESWCAEGDGNTQAQYAAERIEAAIRQEPR